MRRLHLAVELFHFQQERDVSDGMVQVFLQSPSARDLKTNDRCANSRNDGGKYVPYRADDGRLHGRVSEINRREIFLCYEV